MKKLLFWIKNARSIALPQSLLPAILAITMAAKYEEFSLWLSLIALIGVVFAHLGMNLADDFFDYRQKTTEIRSQLTDSGKKAHIKCHYLLSGEATEKQLLMAMCSFLAIAGTCGFIVLLFRGWHIALVAILGLILGIQYSGKPLKLGYHGLGEVLIGILFGPLLMIGMQLAASKVFDQSILIVSICVGLLVINILYSHSIMDMFADEKSNKMTLARLLKNRRPILIASALFNLLPFCIIVISTILGITHWSSLITLILLPMAIYLIYSLTAFVDKKEIPLVPKWWMGPMGEFEKYKAANMDWFLMRWLVARNLVSFFCLILTLSNLIILLKGLLS
ncbi:MAG: prenyltransferase [Paludibacteraceae bacterium]|nr:prenyltransferase [Paludibacteraceae bacterium]